jgi:uncharacterized protein
MSKERTDYCEGCESRCCKYFTVPLDVPEDADDFDALKWYILHEGVSIYIDDDGDWYVNFVSRCRALGADGLCKVYDDRPEICRTHDYDVCEKDDTPYDFREHFFTVGDLMDYAKKVLKPKKKKGRKRRRKKP